VTDGCLTTKCSTPVGTRGAQRRCVVDLLRPFTAPPESTAQCFHHKIESPFTHSWETRNGIGKIISKHMISFESCRPARSCASLPAWRGEVRERPIRTVSKTDSGRQYKLHESQHIPYECRGRDPFSLSPNFPGFPLSSHSFHNAFNDCVTMRGFLSLVLITGSG
jgi:hypothetical protein